MSDPLETRRFPLVLGLSFRILSLFLKQLVRNDGDRPEKFDLSRPALQGHSRSLEPTQIDRLCNIY